MQKPFLSIIINFFWLSIYFSFKQDRASDNHILLISSFFPKFPNAFSSLFSRVPQKAPSSLTTKGLKVSCQHLYELYAPYTHRVFFSRGIQIHKETSLTWFQSYWYLTFIWYAITYGNKYPISNKLVIWMNYQILFLFMEMSITHRLWRCQWCTEGHALHLSCLFQAWTKCLTRADKFCFSWAVFPGSSKSSSAARKSQIFYNMKMRGLP